MPEIKYDAPLTEIWTLDGDTRKHRVYRGRTKAHIEWKIEEYQRRKIEFEVVEIIEELT